MFGRKKTSYEKASKQEIKIQIQELKQQAAELSNQGSPDSEELGAYYSELVKCYKALADAESFPLLEEEYRDKAAKWRRAAEKESVVNGSPIATEVTDSDPEETAQAGSNDNDGTETAGEGPEEATQVVNDDDESAEEMFNWQEPETTFSDIGGRGEIIGRLNEIVVKAVENKEQHEEYGVPVPNGVLFRGPPGTGKTTLAKALAGELDREFLDISLGDIRGSLAGESEQNLQRLFQQAIAEQPCLIMIDEVEAMVYDRKTVSDSGEMRQLISQFLGDMPSLTGEDVLIVGSTNIKGDLDDAADRPGRFGHQFDIGMPDGECRLEVLSVHLEDRPVVTSEVDLRAIARHTQDYSCADLEAVVIEAARLAMQEDTYITQDHLKEGIKEVSPSVDVEKW